MFGVIAEGEQPDLYRNFGRCCPSARELRVAVAPPKLGLVLSRDTFFVSMLQPSQHHLTRPVVGRASQLLEGRCIFFEASAEQCPDLASTFRPVPALVLLKGTERLWSMDFTRPSGFPPSPSQSWQVQLVQPLVKAKVGISADKIKAKVGISADEIAKEVQLEIARNSYAKDGSTTNEVVEFADSGARETVMRKDSTPVSKHDSWVGFLALNGLPRDGHLATLSRSEGGDH